MERCSPVSLFYGEDMQSVYLRLRKSNWNGNNLCPSIPDAIGNEKSRNDRELDSSKLNSSASDMASSQGKDTTR